MVENIHPQKNAQAKYFVQTLGGMGDPSVQTHATQLTTRLVKLTGAEPKLLSVQGVTTSREARLLMMGDPFVRDTLDLFGSISLAIVGIGAVGDVSLRFFDKDGNLVKTPLDERVIGISLEDLSKIERVIALAGGREKTAAIAGALRIGVIDMLVTDKFTAERLTHDGSSTGHS